jgi:hypothetical protein
MKVETIGTLGSETVYQMPFNEKNLQELVSLRENDTDITFTIKDERNEKATEVRKDVNINKTLELFMKPFNYLANAEYITPVQRAQLRQIAIDEGIIAPNTPLAPEDTNTPPPKGTFVDRSLTFIADCSRGANECKNHFRSYRNDNSCNNN